MSFSQDELDMIMLHPLQFGCRQAVETLISELRACTSAADHLAFQGLLFDYVREIEVHRSFVRRALKRLSHRKPLPPDAPDLPPGRDPHSIENWKLEDITTERVLRHLRSVGDALAWRASGFDRRHVLALSRNAHPGQMTGKAGLDRELGFVLETWNERGNFALLHDLTSCLRIGDVTEFHADGNRTVWEIKTSRGGKRDRVQRRRMKAAMAALNEGAPLPGSNEQLVVVDVDFQTHLARLSEALIEAREQGVVGVAIPGHRALLASNITSMAASTAVDDVRQWSQIFEDTRAEALRFAGIAGHKHHLVQRTGDWAARSPVAVPHGVYPISPADAADLICDFAIAETTMSASAFVEAAHNHGLHAELMLPQASGDLAGGQPMFRLGLGNNSVVVHAAVSQQFLGELIDTDAFLAAMTELLTSTATPKRPVITFRNEQDTWM